jgi:UDP-2,3-diacylglucosamine pyrophosphatase LpxH
MTQAIERFPETRDPALRLVVSDFHLGSGRWLPCGRANCLEDFAFDEEFADFLEFHSSGEFEDRPVELVLNGDILNLLQMEDHGVHSHLHTERFVCRALQRIIDGHRIFFDALSRFAASPKRRIVYVIGNHDAGLLWPAPRKLFERRVGVEVVFHPVYYRFHGVHVEHGHQHEELSRMDMERPFITQGLPEPVLNLPWGSLFVAVMLSRIKVERPHVDKVRPFSGFLRYVLLHDTFWSIGAVLRIAWFAWETVMFRSRYHIRSGLRASWRMFRELTVYPDFDHAAESILAADPSLRLVVFGHTHVLRHRRFEDGREYVNEGSWNEATHLELGDFGTQVRLTYAHVVCSGMAPRVSLKRWRGRWRPDPDVVF